MSIEELVKKELWHLTDEELIGVQKMRANVKLIKDFSRKGKQLNIKF